MLRKVKNVLKDNSGTSKWLNNDRKFVIKRNKAIKHAFLNCKWCNMSSLWLIGKDAAVAKLLINDSFCSIESIN